jgi:kinase domain protein
MEKNITETIYIASLVLGICSILFCAIPILGLILSIVSVIISIKARKRLKQENENKGIVTAGMVLSIVSLILACIITILVVVVPIGGSIILNVTDSKDVNVPNVVGLTVEEAQEKVESVGLKFEIDKKEFSSNTEEGCIISQNPSYLKNYKVKQGSYIEVIVSKGEE